MKQEQNPIDDIARVAQEAVEKIEAVSVEAGYSFERAAKPVRRHVLKRFPTLFLLLVTFGVISVSLGIEQLLLKYASLKEHPLIMVIIGLFTLILTGTLYKKLG